MFLLQHTVLELVKKITKLDSLVQRACDISLDLFCLGDFQVVLKENLILPLFRDEVKLKIMLYLQSIHWCSYSDLIFYWFVQYILLHENYQLYVLPKVLESKRMAKSGRTKQKEADLEYNIAKQVEKMLTYVLHNFCSFYFFPMLQSCL